MSDYPNQYQGQGYVPQQQFDEPPKKGKGIGIAALILGILTFVGAIVPALGMFIGTFLGIIAVILGIVGIVKRSGRPLAIVGIVLAVLAIPASIASTIFFGAAVIEENGGNVSELVNLMTTNENVSQEDIEHALGNKIVNSMAEAASNEAQSAAEGAANGAVAAVNTAANAIVESAQPDNAIDDEPAEQYFEPGNTPIYQNDMFGVIITDGDGQRALRTTEFGVDVTYRASSTAELYCQVLAAPAADTEAYYAFERESRGDQAIQDVFVAGHTVPGIIEERDLGDGDYECNITIVKIVNGQMCKITSVGASREEAQVAFDAVTAW